MRPNGHNAPSPEPPRKFDEFRKSLERRIRDMNVFVNLKKETGIGENPNSENK